MRKTAGAIVILLVYSIFALAQAAPPDSAGRVAGPGGGSMKASLTEPAAPAGDTLRQVAVQPEPRKIKSIKKAFFLSLAVPGAGEYYVGKKRYTRGFLASEALIWSFALFSRYQGSMWRDDYIAFAAQSAGANPSRSDDLYYQNIYEWPNSEWYNEYLWAEARDLYPDNPAAQADYVAGKLYSPEDAWEWQSTEDWDRFRNLRVRSESAYRRVTYAAGAALLNHLLSAVNAARLAKSNNDGIRRKKRIAVGCQVLPTWDGGMSFTVTGKF